MLCFFYGFREKEREREKKNRIVTSVIVPTFDTKVTEYLCSGRVFFSSDKFRLFNKPFLTDFFISFEKYCCLELKFEKIFHL